MSDHDTQFDADEPSAEQPFHVPAELPVLPLRDTVLFPNSFMPLAVARESSVRLIDEAVAAGRLIAVFTQREASEEEPRQDDLHPIGTASHIHKMFKLPDGSLRIIVQGLARVRLDGLIASRPYLRASVSEAQRRAVATTTGSRSTRCSATSRPTSSRSSRCRRCMSDDLQTLATNIAEPGRAADFIASSLGSISTDTKQEVLETLDVRPRLDLLNRLLIKELEVLELGSKIQSQVQSEVGKNQRDYFLREQLKAIQRELGEGDDQTKEIEELRQKIEAAGLPDTVKKEALRELDRLSKMPPAAAEYTVSRTYLDWMVALPWAKRTEEVIDLPQDARGARHTSTPASRSEGAHPRVPRGAQAQPRREGPDPVLRRPSGRRQDVAGALDRAVARPQVRARLARRHARRGRDPRPPPHLHRRAAGPVIQGLRRAESKNPVFILDEIDKLGSDFRGDPASALLEVLDPEQNNTFRDHYLDVPFDLSEVLFITTANVLDPIPPALRDRMEVLELAGYTEEEKLAIARDHLVGKQVPNHGLTLTQLAFTDAGAAHAHPRLHARSRRAQSRARDRRASAARWRAGAPRARPTACKVTPDVVHELLGAPRFLDEEMAERTKQPGVAIGLAWTPVGGEVLFVEASRMAGTASLTLTGQLGDVMKESARAALSWVRAHAAEWASIPTSSRRRRSTCTCRRARFRRTARRRASPWPRRSCRS